MSTDHEVTLTITVPASTAARVIAVLNGEQPTAQAAVATTASDRKPTSTRKPRASRATKEGPPDTALDPDPMPAWAEGGGKKPDEATAKASGDAPKPAPTPTNGKGSTAAPVDTTQGEDGTEGDEVAQKEAAAGEASVTVESGEVPAALKTAEKAREVFGALIAEGYNDAKKLKEICRKWQSEIPFLSKFGDNLDDRVDRACDVLFR